MCNQYLVHSESSINLTLSCSCSGCPDPTSFHPDHFVACCPTASPPSSTCTSLSWTLASRGCFVWTRRPERWGIDHPPPAAFDQCPVEAGVQAPSDEITHSLPRPPTSSVTSWGPGDWLRVSAFLSFPPPTLLLECLGFLPNQVLVLKHTFGG